MATPTVQGTFGFMKDPTPVHACHARGCSERVEPAMLLCKKHWFKVPVRVRNAVWHAYRPGQENDKSPSAAWREAADAAIGFVALLEGRKITDAEKRALDRFEVPR